MTVGHWHGRFIPLVLAALLGACEDPDPLAPSFAGSSAGSTVAAPTNLTASAASYHQIWLAWQDNATNESGFEVYRSTTGPTGTFTLFTTYPWPNTTQGGNDGLQASTQYCYNVRAFSTLGQSGKVRAYSGFSNTACVTTLGLPVPLAPSGVNAAPRFNGWAVNVTWTDNSTDETGFRVERSATDAGPWTSIGSTGPGATSFDDWQFPSSEQPACYRVFAVNSYGNSGPSNVDCTTVPIGPTNLGATVAGDGSVDLTWTDVSSVEDGFAVYRWTAQGAFTLVGTSPANAAGYHDPWVGDSTYYYRVYATKESGTSGGSNTISVQVISMPPATPTDLNAVPAASTVVVAAWVDASANAQGFRVERSTDGGGSWVTAGTAGADETSFGDGGLPSEQQVCYRVIAFNFKGESAPSNTGCTIPPAGPTNFTATAVDAVTVDFAWTDNSAVEDGYQVERDASYCDYDGCYFYFEPIVTLGPNATSYRATDLNLSDTFFVVALKDGGYSDFSNFVSPTGAPAASSLRTGSTARAPVARRPVKRRVP